MAITGVWLSACLLAGDPQPVPLVNPGFELPADATGELSPGWRQTRGALAEVRRDGGHTGAAYLRLADPSPSEGAMVESGLIPARPEGHYTAIAWLRPVDACAPGLYLQFHNRWGQRIAETHVRASRDQVGVWQELQVSGVAPRLAESVSIGLYGYAADVGSFDADDVSLSVTGGRDPGPPWARPAPGDRPMIAIADRLEPFLDDALIDSLAGDVRHVLGQPRRENIAFTFDAPWEGPTCAYVSLIPDGDLVRMYYRGSGGGAGEVTCYAESRDGGLTFTRPELGLHTFAGSRANNIIGTGVGAHNFCAFRDDNPACEPDQRYKALGGEPLFAFASADGIHWRQLSDQPVITKGAFDSQNVPFWDAARGEYACVFRVFANGVRTIRVTRSADFLNWSEPEEVSFGDAPPEHLYTNATVPYPGAPHLWMGFPMRFVPERRSVAEHPEMGVSDAVLMCTRDRVNWTRWRPALIRPGLEREGWTDRTTMVARGLVVNDPETISLYYSEHYRHPTSRLRRATLRTDGFASLQGGPDGGELLTRPLLAQGSRLVLNVATSAAGAVQVAVCDEAGEPLPGLGFTDQEPLYGDSVAQVVTWGDRTDLSDALQRPVRLRIILIEADLYSLRFSHD